jgi:hypothetical protein
MQWSRYEVFSVISGLIMVAAGLAVTMPGKDRLAYIGGGAALVGYGCYVAGQDSGTYYFPSAIFFVPIAAVVLAVVKAVGRRRESDAGRQDG